ncbi:uncharacterized protein LOC126367151 isoform X1 [Pectinophora gossypiella]|uniref:uncharacterized protein LOC126367151 isoform X1 n=1 Tax=Pectinophora gossypiella TaxID=13191 RepID=UPI00214F3B5F|nr:uncharacterized protein LOC126367151 isoform X1 [Pectinophora gossypiella]
MCKKTLYFVLIAYLILNVVDAKKTRRKRPKAEEDSTPQPNVVTYSTFGFNDVGSYDGFMPSSPEYVSYLNNYNQDSATRLYAPAFPTALDNYPSPSQDSHTFSLGDDTGPQASMLQYPQSSVSFMNTPSLDNEAQSQNNAPEIYGRNNGDSGAPIYGTKLSSGTSSKNNKNKQFSQFNNSDFNLFSSASSPQESKYSSFHEVQPTFEGNTPSFAEPNKNYHFSFNYATTHPSTENDDFLKSAPSNTQNTVNFPKVVDFTKYKQYYPSELETKFTTTTTKSPNTYKPVLNIQNDNSYFEEFSTKYPIPPPTFKNPYNKEKDAEEATEKDTPKPSPYSDNEFTQNYLNYPKNAFKDAKLNFDFKDKFKYHNNNWASTNYSNDFKNWKNPIKGYQYSTNYSNMNFEFDFSGGKKPVNTNNDEIVPASSNLVDLTSYQFPETDYSNLKKVPGLKNHDTDDIGNVFESLKPQGYKYDPEDYVKSLYSTAPTSSLWGSMYKLPEFSSYKHLGKKPQYGEDIGDDVVHIPKRPYSNKYNFGKYVESKPTEWSSYTSHRPYKPKKPISDWNKEASTRFKSEEDLLGLRTHDTSHPSYLPTYKPGFNSLSSDYDYKKLVEKWRQSYLKAKYKDVGLQDFDSYASEPKPHHVPLPKPYPVQVPVIKPFPVPVPHIRPVFHHTRSKEDEEEEDDYLPRPETSKRIPYAKRPRSTRPRPRRPTRTHSERNRRRWPVRRPSDPRNRRPDFPSPYRQYDSEFDDFEHTHSEYILHCKRTGNC